MARFEFCAARTVAVASEVAEAGHKEIMWSGDRSGGAAKLDHLLRIECAHDDINEVGGTHSLKIGRAHMARFSRTE